jgi:hypothetical protein
VLVPAPLEFERIVHRNGTVRVYGYDFSVGRPRGGSLVRVRVEDRVLHVVDEQGRLIKSVPRNPEKEASQAPLRPRRNNADRQGVKDQPTSNRQTSTAT